MLHGLAAPDWRGDRKCRARVVVHKDREGTSTSSSRRCTRSPVSSDGHRLSPGACRDAPPQLSIYLSIYLSLTAPSFSRSQAQLRVGGGWSVLRAVSLAERPQLHGLIPRDDACRAIVAEQTERIARMVNGF